MDVIYRVYRTAGTAFCLTLFLNFISNKSTSPHCLCVSFIEKSFGCSFITVTSLVNTLAEEDIAHGRSLTQQKKEKKASVSGLHLCANIHSVWPSLKKKKKITAGYEDSFTDVRVSKWIFSNSTICINPEQCLLLIKVSRELSSIAEVKKFCFAPRNFCSSRLLTKRIELKHCRVGYLC